MSTNLNIYYVMTMCGLKIGAGEYWLKMFDSFAGTLGLVVVAFMEMIAVVYVYGHKK